GRLLTDPEVTAADQFDPEIYGTEKQPRKPLDWPYQKNDEFPFVPLAFEKRPRGLWSLNAVGRLVKPQRSFNKVISRIEDRVNNDKVIVLEPRGAETGSDDPYHS